ncbi:MAG: DUF6265 family protein [Candidatus Wenzhouxiangella sp. M2_3B_020]
MNSLLFASVLFLAQGAMEEPAEPHARIELSDLQWLEGCWEGTGFGKRVTECWMSAPDGRLTGMFQMIGADGSQEMSEIFVLDEFEGGPALRLKHFHADLTGWEAQDDFVVFPLIETGEGFARFDGLTYRLSDDGRLIVDLVVSREGEESVERLEFERAGGGE